MGTDINLAQRIEPRGVGVLIVMENLFVLIILC